MLNNTLIILALSILTFLALFFIPVLMTRSASNRVMKIFCQHGAVSATNARTPEDLGLAPLGFVDRLMKPRDYKPQALRYLKEAGIIHTTPDGRLYLSQVRLHEELRCRNLVGKQVKAMLGRPSGKDRSHKSL